MPVKSVSLNRRLTAEFLGTLFLLAVVVGSGIMGDRLSSGITGLALLANALATGAGLIVLILIFGEISGAHFNPLVSIAETLHGRISKGILPLYLVSQLAGAFAGVMVAHLMFGETYLGASTHAREGFSSLFSEFVATFGLIATIRGVRDAKALPFAIGLYIAAAYWFTASTSFANPAVTLARAFTGTFAGIRLVDVPGFCLAQICGAVAAEFVFRWLQRPQLVEDSK